MQFEDLHTAESDFFMKIDVAAELSARNVVNEYLTPSGFKPVRLDDSRAYFIPQQRAEGSSPSITVRYGSIVELVVTYPTENDLRKALFQLHEMEYGTRPCGFFEYRAATENYERVLKRRRADIPPNLTQSPNQLPIPESLLHKLGKRHRWVGSGHSSNLDRIYIREMLAAVIDDIGCYAIEIILHFPSTLLKNNIQITLAGM